MGGFKNGVKWPPLKNVDGWKKVRKSNNTFFLQIFYIYITY